MRTPKLSAYVPAYNNGTAVLAAVESLRLQQPPIDDIFVLDDGSNDGSAETLESIGVRVYRQSANLGRGAARRLAMVEAKAEFVICCDATNVLPPDFVSRLLSWFEDPKVAAVYGRIQDPSPQKAIGRWRARHLFKAGQAMGVTHRAPLITYGTILRRSAALEVGNFSEELRHSEDAELGERLLSAGYDIVADPQVPVFCNKQNSISEVLERYWRWYAGKNEGTSWRGYGKTVGYSIKAMAWQDLRAGDPIAALISLVCPHYQFWMSRVRSCRRAADLPIEAEHQ